MKQLSLDITNTKNIEMWHHSRNIEDLQKNWGEVQVFLRSDLDYFNGLNLYCLGKGIKYGLVQQYIISMETSATKIIEIMLKRTFRSKPC